MHGGVDPVNIHPSFKKGFKEGNKLQKKRNAKKDASVSDRESAYSGTDYNASQFAPEEEIQK